MVNIRVLQKVHEKVELKYVYLGTKNSEILAFFQHPNIAWQTLSKMAIIIITTIIIILESTVS